MNANQITAALLIAISERWKSRIVCWRNNRIKAKAIGAGGRLRVVSAGIDGQGDLTGIISPRGVRLEIEVKAGKDRLSQDQINFGRMIREHGGIYIIARDVEGALAELAKEMP